MKNIKLIKKGDMANETIIIWVVVIIVVIMAAIFIRGSNIDTWMKNLPGFKGPGEQDRTIDIDIPFEFDCKYPIGKIPIKAGRRTIHLLSLDDIKETEFKEISNQLEKAKEIKQLAYNPNNGGKIEFNLNDFQDRGRIRTLIEEMTNQIIEIGKLKPIFRNKIKTNWNDIIMNPDYSGLMNQIDPKIMLLDKSKYESTIGWICGDSTQIENLKDKEICKESCELYGGTCQVGRFEGDFSKEIIIDNLCKTDGEYCVILMKQEETHNSIMINNLTYKEGNNLKELKSKNGLDLVEYILSMNVSSENDYCTTIRMRNEILNQEFIEITEETQEKVHNTEKISFPTHISIITFIAWNPLTKEKILRNVEVNLTKHRSGLVEWGTMASTSTFDKYVTNMEKDRELLIRNVNNHFNKDVSLFKIKKTIPRVRRNGIEVYVNYPKESDSWHKLNCRPWSTQSSIVLSNVKTTFEETILQCKWK